jgi:hypothetical protein
MAAASEAVGGQQVARRLDGDMEVEWEGVGSVALRPV